MLIAGLLLFSTSLLHTKPAPVFADICIRGSGPYRFLVDTGSETSLIEPELAAELKLQPQFRVEVITQNTTRLLPGLKIEEIRIGQKRLHDVEIVFHDLAEARRLDPSIVGVLGMNALDQFDFALRPRSATLDIAPARPPGQAVPFYRIEDRLAIKARMGREDLTLIVDSGATHIVLFRMPKAMANSPALPTTFGTLEGARSAVPTCWTAGMTFSRSLRFGTLPAAVVSRRDSRADGLIPASLFREIYVDHTRSEIVLVQ